MPIVIRKYDNPELYKHVVNTNLIRQADFLKLSFDVAIDNGFQISVPFVKDLHSIAMVYLVDEHGQTRDHDVQIKAAKHTPPSHDKVDQYLVEFVSIIRKNWDNWDELKLAAFVKWRLDWIHPFEDGNGRTSRALTYFVLCCKAKLWFKGSNTVIRQMRDNREEVFNCLREADDALESVDDLQVESVNLSSLEILIKQMIEEQFESQ